MRSYMYAGGLMSYAVSLDETYRRIAIFGDKILKGAKPADLPVEQPTRFELMINLTEAKALGLTIPPSLLLRAERLSSDQPPDVHQRSRCRPRGAGGCRTGGERAMRRTPATGVTKALHQ